MCTHTFLKGCLRGSVLYKKLCDDGCIKERGLRQLVFIYECAVSGVCITFSTHFNTEEPRIRCVCNWSDLEHARGASTLSEFRRQISESLDKDIFRCRPLINVSDICLSVEAGVMVASKFSLTLLSKNFKKSELMRTGINKFQREYSILSMGAGPH